MTKFENGDYVYWWEKNKLIEGYIFENLERHGYPGLMYVRNLSTGWYLEKPAYKLTKIVGGMGMTKFTVRYLDLDGVAKLKDFEAVSRQNLEKKMSILGFKIIWIQKRVGGDK